MALRKRRITHVLNMAVETENFFVRIYCIAVPQPDKTAMVGISESLHRIVDFADSAHVAQGRVLVHCNSGISRSSAAVSLISCDVCRFASIRAEPATMTTTLRKERRPPRGAGMAQGATAHRESPSRADELSSGRSPGGSARPDLAPQRRRYRGRRT